MSEFENDKRAYLAIVEDNLDQAEKLFEEDLSEEDKEAAQQLLEEAQALLEEAQLELMGEDASGDDAESEEKFSDDIEELVEPLVLQNPKDEYFIRAKVKATLTHHEGSIDKVRSTVKWLALHIKAKNIQVKAKSFADR